MKNNKGFTLIELLAVIIILGILMIIAIPSVTTYISNSRKTSYVDSIKELVGAARNLVNSGKLETYDRGTTYYIPVSCLPTENGARTPYGDFSTAYVLVTYSGDGYDYYYTGNDTSKTGVRTVVPIEKLTEENIETEVEDTDILTDVAVSGRNKIVVFSDKCDNKQELVAANVLNDDGTVTEKVSYIESRFSGGHSLDNEKDFWQYRDSICSITFKTTIEEPSSYAYKYDVSEDKDGSVMAYVVNGNGGCKNVLIEANGYIYANPDSSYMFAHMYALSSINNIENLKVDYVTNMSWMFAFVGNFTEFDLSSWNTSRVTDMSYMFTSGDDFFFLGGQTLDLSYLDTSNVTDMSYMFYDLYYVSAINVNGFNTSKVTNMDNMFSRVNYSSYIDIRSFDTRNVTNMNQMFWADYSLEYILVGSNWSTNKVTTSTNMFEYSAGLPNYNPNVVDKTNANTGPTGYLSTEIPKN